MLNEYSIDLHMHSLLSDARETPVQVVDKAASVGLKKIVLCDHNALHPNYDRLRSYAATKGVELPFMGCEVTAAFYYDRRPVFTLHMLVYGEDHLMRDSRFTEMIAHFDDIKNARALRELRRLVIAGAPVTFEEAFCYDRDIAPFEKNMKLSERPVMKCIAKNLGITEDEACECYAEYLENLDFGKDWLRQLCVIPSAEELVRLAREIGLVTVVAHPAWMDNAFFEDNEITREAKTDMIRRLAECGLDGIETCHELLDAETKAYYDGLASELGLITTGGSDYHAEPEYGRHLTEYGVTEEQFAVLENLVHSRAEGK